jgi:hypothetical protein
VWVFQVRGSGIGFCAQTYTHGFLQLGHMETGWMEE